MPRLPASETSITSELDMLAKEHGVSLVRPSPQKVDITITDATKRKVLAALGVAVDGGPERPAGRSVAKHTCKEITRQCFLPKFLEMHRVWGISLQLYELRSERNWGIGDFGDLIEMIHLAASLGADFVGLNPLHAPFLADPARCSPYEPSNRQMLNPLYIAVDKVDGFETRPEIQEQLQELRSVDLVDYMRVAKIKMAALRDIWKRWESLPISSSADHEEFAAFVRGGGELLRRHAIFEALSESMSEKGHGAGWKCWPVEYQRPENAEIDAFVNEHSDTIYFHIWLQWLAHRQLTQATGAARDAGLRIGLYLDLAVGEAVDGSATWSQRGTYISDATIGSPPDPFAPAGQDWRLAAFHPAAIAAGRQAPFRHTLCAIMRYAGAIRIDHAAALRRLFLVPVECGADEGAYVDYPQDELLQILADASSQFKCLVIGEDLGVLPDGLQRDLSDARILSYRILSYERDEDGFKPTSAYPKLSLACISTHDHQTMAGWWLGRDIEARSDHRIVPPDLTQVHMKERQHERKDLIAALTQAQTAPPVRLPHANAGNDRLNNLTLSAHRFIARTPSVLAAVRLADMTGEKRPTNIPGTRDSYPNWKPKLSVSVERLASLPLLLQIAEAMRVERARQ